ncbi:MAG: hypothetical protein HKN25_13790 [Pyrinomonadaceae bacterium]|nr:hypothetical protein [Pyrinomonadaceae bacterium]
MSFTLIDSSSEGFEFTANVWRWKATLAVVKSFNILSEAAVRQMGSNASGTEVSMDEAQLIGTRIREEILPKLEPNKRIFANLSITDAPDDGTIYKDGDEQWKNFSVKHDWLDDFAEFCLKSKGFRVY